MAKKIHLLPRHDKSATLCFCFVLFFLLCWPEFGHILSFLNVLKIPNNTQFPFLACVVHYQPKNTCPNPLKPLQNKCKETNLNMLGQSVKPKWMVEIDLKEITCMIIPLRKVLGAFIIAYK